MSESVILFGTRKEMENRLIGGKLLRIRIGEKEYFLVRHQEAVFVTGTKCPHFGYTLENARVNPMGQLVCPWHGYRYDLKSGREYEDKCRSLEVYPTSWDTDGQLIVNLENE